jgi:phage terminase Nu1 subunit (DNA packaging protein)
MAERGGPSETLERWRLARARLAEAQAAQAEEELQRKRGELLDRAKVMQDVATIVSAARNRLLGLPAKAISRIPRLDRSDFATLDALVRDVLEELAGGFDRASLAPEKEAADA